MNAVRKTGLITLCVLAIGSAFAQPKKMTLKECIELAIKNNLDVQTRGLQAQTAKANLLQARGNMLPDLNAGVNHGAQQGRSINPYTNTYSDANLNYANYSLTSNVTLFNGFSIQNNIKANKFAYEAAGMEEQQQKDNVTLNVILAYLQVLTNEDLVDLSQRQAVVSGQQVDRLEILNKEGAVSPLSDLYDLRGQLANDRLSVVNNNNSLETARLTLAQLLNINYSKELDVERLTLDQISFDYDSNTTTIYQTAEKNLALIKAVDLRSLSAKYNVKANKGLQYPSLVLSGGLFTNYSSAATTQELVSVTDRQSDSYVNDNGTKLFVFNPEAQYQSHQIAYGSQFKNNKSTSFGLGLSIPLLNAFRVRSQIATAKIQEKLATVNATATRTQLQRSVEQAYVNLSAATKRYQALSEQVEAYKESFRIAEVRFNAGAINSVDYLVAKNRMDQANVNLIVARYDYVLRTKVLDFYQGRPLW